MYGRLWQQREWVDIAARAGLAHNAERHDCASGVDVDVADGDVTDGAAGASTFGPSWSITVPTMAP